MSRALALLVALLPLLGAGDGAVAAPPDVAASWVVDRTRAVQGETRMVCLRPGETASEERTFPLEVRPEGSLEVLRPPRALAGEELAWARILPRRPGPAELVVPGAGEAGRLHVEVEPPRRAVDPPRVTTPADGSHVWGSFLVGGRVPGPPPASVRLLADERVVADDLEVHREGEARAVRTPVDAADLPAGSLLLRLEVEAADGSTRRGPGRRVTVVHPAEDRPLAREAEDLAGLELPDGWGNTPRVREQASASGGAYTVHVSQNPPVRFPVEPGETTRYQVAVVARGDRAAGAWPSVGVTIDRPNRTHAHGPTLEGGWHRVIVGEPVRVEAGSHWIGARFTNDRYVPDVLDRNLFIDRVELLPVEAGPGADEVRIGLATPLDGADVHGSFTVRAHRIAREDRAGTPSPVTHLELNGRRVARQRSDRPRFRVGTADLRRGENELRLVCEPAPGVEVATRTARFTWRGEGSRPDGLLRFTASEEGWTTPRDDVVRFDRRAPDGRILRFNSVGGASLALPEDLEGRFHLSLYARGEVFEGRPEARVTLDGEEVGTAGIRGGWRSTRVATVELEPGPKEVGVGFINDRYEPDVGDRNLLIGAVELRPAPAKADETPPTVDPAYPSPGATIARTDAVVCDVRDAAGVDRAMLLADGEPVPGAFALVRRGVRSRVCLPFILRDRPPGPVDLAVRVRDRSGRWTRTEPIRVELSDDPSASPYAAAVHFLNRFAYGPEPHLLGRVLVEGPAACLDAWLARGPDRLAVEAARARWPNDRSVGHVLRRVVALGVTTSNPAHFRLTHLLDDHFSTWIRKARAHREWREVRSLQERAAGRFRDLLLASARSPAMIRYLDQRGSVAGRSNENYARELLELHTLGVDGGYDQTDVEALTGLLTGWSTCREDRVERFAFVPGLHDPAGRTLLGLRVPALPDDAPPAEARDRVRAVLELLAAHPSTARFVARKLVRHYAAVPAPDVLVDDIARTYLGTQGDLVEMLGRLATHPAFAEASPADKGLDPFEYGLRLVRCGGWPGVGAVFRLLRATQRLPLDRATPDGYPEEEDAWFDSSHMLQRWRFAEHVAGPLRGRLFRGPGRRPDGPDDRAWAGELVDHVAVRLTGRPLGERSRATVIGALREADGGLGRRLGLAISLVGQVPEASLH